MVFSWQMSDFVLFCFLSFSLNSKQQLGACGGGWWCAKVVPASLTPTLAPAPALSHPLPNYTDSRRTCQIVGGTPVGVRSCAFSCEHSPPPARCPCCADRRTEAEAAGGGEARRVFPWPKMFMPSHSGLYDAGHRVSVSSPEGRY